MKVVFATHNPEKFRELNAFLRDKNIELISQGDLGVPEVAETGLTFIENALIKAHHASNLTGLPAIADDSGLVVPALSYAPGIYSNRYASENATQADNINKLLNELSGFPHDARYAYFYCVLVMLPHPKNPEPLIAEGRWHGLILLEPKGDNGFGYDPIFFDEKEKCSAAELDILKKNQISHRGQAMRKLWEQL